MATEAHKFQVGVFVIATSIIGVGALIWLGASRYFERTEAFVTYFNESVQGLDPGASVKYRGVPGGRVASISVAPDNELIEVRMDIDPKIAEAIKNDRDLRATLELSGITGLRYVEIERKTGAALEQSPYLHFKAPATVILSSRSSFKAVQEALKDVYDRVMAFDLPGISNDIRNALQTFNGLMSDERIDAVLSNLKATTQTASQLARNLETMTAGVQLAPAVENATQATAQARDLFTDLSKGPTGQQLAQAVAQLNALVQASQQAVVTMQYTLQRLDRTAVNLQGLSDELRTQPSRLLFSDPPPDRATSGRGDR
jgi:phospholipid/cholesterol/gamma-HCH transport system substrate-binding protein